MRNPPFLILMIVVMSVIALPSNAVADGSSGAAEKIKYGGFVGIDTWEGSIVAVTRYGAVLFDEGLGAEKIFNADEGAGTLTGRTVVIGDTLYVTSTRGAVGIDLRTGENTLINLGYPTWDITSYNGTIYLAGGEKGVIMYYGDGVANIGGLHCLTLSSTPAGVLASNGSAVTVILNGAVIGEMDTGHMVYLLRYAGGMYLLADYSGEIVSFETGGGVYKEKEVWKASRQVSEIIAKDNDLLACLGRGGINVIGSVSYVVKPNLHLSAHAEGIKAGITDITLLDGRIYVLSTGFGIAEIDTQGRVQNSVFDTTETYDILVTGGRVFGRTDYAMMDIITGEVILEDGVYYFIDTPEGIYMSTEDGIHTYDPYTGSLQHIIPLESPPLAMAYSGGVVYYSTGDDTLYSMENSVILPVWEAPGGEKIISLEPYTAGILVGTESAVYRFTTEEVQKLFDTGNWCFQVTYGGGVVVAACSESGVFIHYIENKTTVNLPTGVAKSCYALKNRVYVGTDTGLEVWDVNGEYKATYPTRATVNRIAYSGDYLYFSTMGDGIYRISQRIEDSNSNYTVHPEYIGYLIIMLAVVVTTMILTTRKN